VNAKAWQMRGACRKADPELFFPAGTTGPNLVLIDDAKAYCRSCPVQVECLRWALDNRQEAGIWGGTTEQDRVTIRRRAARAAAAAEKPLPVLRANLTIAEVYAALTTAVVEGGHVDWLGGGATTVNGSCYSPNRLAWAVTRGTPPVGSVVRYCARPDCVAHIEDRAERETRKAVQQQPEPVSKCGTRPGYQAHRKRGETACDTCRQANTDADNRLRRTGTTKQRAAA
jgi:hypothetical protein